MKENGVYEWNVYLYVVEWELAMTVCHHAWWRMLCDGNMSPCIRDLFVFDVVAVDDICYLCSSVVSLKIVRCPDGHPYISLGHQKWQTI